MSEVFNYDTDTQLVVIVTQALAGLGCVIMACWFLLFTIKNIRLIRQMGIKDKS